MSMTFKSAVALVALLGATLAVNPALALQGPPGMQRLCASTPSVCRGGGAEVVVASKDLQSLIKQVNRQVNASIKYRNEKGDTWSLYPKEGDCEDFALTKRAELIRHGVDASSLRIGLTTTRRGQPHAVLIVKTTEGDYILDNFTNEVKQVGRSQYRIIAMSSANPKRWVRG